MKIILTNNMEAKIDLEDYEFLKNHSWWFNETFKRVCRSEYRVINGKKKQYEIKMDSAILPHDKSKVVVYKNGDYLDLRKDNLLIVDKSSANQRHKLQKNNKSGFKGVGFFNNRWVASIRVDRKLIYLGRYKRLTDAALAYNKAALAVYGNDCYLNDIDCGEGLMKVYEGNVPVDPKRQDNGFKFNGEVWKEIKQRKMNRI